MATDVAIIGCGFSGLGVLAHLVESGGAASITVVADDPSGHGLAYGTTDASHLLNVCAHKMGARAGDPEGFARWLETDEAALACRTLGVARPGRDDFAPRALYAHYLDAVRAAALREADARGIAVRWVRSRATGLRRTDAGWAVTTGEGTVDARWCVLATGHEPRSVFGGLQHRDLHHGPFGISAADVAAADPRSPAVVVGSGLTAVDALLTLRGLGWAGRVLAVSRRGRLPQPHDTSLTPVGVDADDVAGLGTLRDYGRFLRDAVARGHDPRAVVDGLRPHTTDLWRRLGADEQAVAARDHASAWNAVRHRMAPDVAREIEAELSTGDLTVSGSQGLRADAPGGRLRLRLEHTTGRTQRLHPALLVDCTGPEADWSRSADPLRRDALASGAVARHPTGLGLRAAGTAIGDGLFAIGSALTGERWESTAVPELREQAAEVVAAVTRARPVVIAA